MKRKMLLMVVVLMIIIGYIFAEKELIAKGDGIIVYNSITSTSSNSCEERISVILNQYMIEDVQACAEMLVEKFRNNDFENMMFSFDLRKPTKLECTVYLAEKNFHDGEKEFSFSFEQEDPYNEPIYNMLDNPEKFSIVIG